LPAGEIMVLKNYHWLLSPAVVCIVLLIFQALVAAADNGTISIPESVWREGDYWNYVTYIGPSPEEGIAGALRVNVGKKAQIVVDNTSYRCRMVNASLQLPSMLENITTIMYENTTLYYLENSSKLVTYVTSTPSYSFNVTYDPIINVSLFPPLRIFMTRNSLQYYSAACYLEYPLTPFESWEKNTTITVGSDFGDDYIQLNKSISTFCEVHSSTQNLRSFGKLDGVSVDQKMEIEGPITPEKISSTFFFAEDFGSIPIKFNVKVEILGGVSMTIELFEYGNEPLEAESGDDILLWVGSAVVIVIGVAVTIVFWRGKKYRKD
jgi:hypothetical protein